MVSAGRSAEVAADVQVQAFCEMAGLNRGLVWDPVAPFGGVEQSGIGCEGAREGLLEFTETRYIATSW